MGWDFPVALGGGGVASVVPYVTTSPPAGAEPTHPPTWDGPYTIHVDNFAYGNGTHDDGAACQAAEAALEALGGGVLQWGLRQYLFTTTNGTVNGVACGIGINSANVWWLGCGLTSAQQLNTAGTPHGTRLIWEPAGSVGQYSPFLGILNNKLVKLSNLSFWNGATLTAGVTPWNGPMIDDNPGTPAAQAKYRIFENLNFAGTTAPFAGLCTVSGTALVTNTPPLSGGINGKPILILGAGPNGTDAVYTVATRNSSTSLTLTGAVATNVSIPTPCQIGGSAPSRSSVQVHGPIVGSLRNTIFANPTYYDFHNGSDAAIGDLGPAGMAAYWMVGCHFDQYALLAHISNPGDGFTICASVFEPLAHRSAGSIIRDIAGPTQGLTVFSNWFGDVTSFVPTIGYSQIQVACAGGVFFANHIEGGDGPIFTLLDCSQIAVRDNYLKGSDVLMDLGPYQHGVIVIDGNRPDGGMTTATAPMVVSRMPSGGDFPAASGTNFYAVVTGGNWTAAGSGNGTNSFGYAVNETVMALNVAGNRTNQFVCQTASAQLAQTATTTVGGSSITLTANPAENIAAGDALGLSLLSLGVNGTVNAGLTTLTLSGAPSIAPVAGDVISLHGAGNVFTVSSYNSGTHVVTGTWSGALVFGPAAASLSFDGTSGATAAFTVSSYSSGTGVATVTPAVVSAGVGITVTVNKLPANDAAGAQWYPSPVPSSGWGPGLGQGNGAGTNYANTMTKPTAFRNFGGIATQNTAPVLGSLQPGVMTQQFQGNQYCGLVALTLSGNIAAGAAVAVITFGTAQLPFQPVVSLTDASTLTVGTITGSGVPASWAVSSFTVSGNEGISQFTIMAGSALSSGDSYVFSYSIDER